MFCPAVNCATSVRFKVLELTPPSDLFLQYFTTERPNYFSRAESCLPDLNIHNKHILAIKLGSLFSCLFISVCVPSLAVHFSIFFITIY